MTVLSLLAARVAQHIALAKADEAALERLPFQLKTVEAEQDVVRQGDRPDVAVFVVDGMLGRYHTIPSGDRQYLSFHIRSEMPDVQSLFLNVMDHSVCAINQAQLALFQHQTLIKLLQSRPNIAFAFWRITLVDAAIFRQAITNNSARDSVPRLAHFCCEQYMRAREAGLADGQSCSLPLNQTQLGQALGMSHISVNRALQQLRKKDLLDLRGGMLEVRNWAALTQVAGFDPTYLHAAKDTGTAPLPVKE